MKYNGKGTVARIDDGVYTHVKIDGKLYRVGHVIEAVREYRERMAAKAAARKEHENGNDNNID